MLLEKREKGVFIMSIIATTMFTIGAMTAAKVHQLTVMWLCLCGLAGLLFSLVGEVFDYLIGHYGRWLLDHFKWAKRFVSEDKMEEGRQFLEKYGQSSIMVSRFIPGVKTVASYAIGATGYSFLKYMLINIIANLLIIVLCGAFGFYLGHIPFVKQHFIAIIMVLLILIFLPAALVTVSKLIKENQKRLSSVKED